MSTLKMKLANKILFTVTSVTFVVALNDVDDVLSTVKFMLTKDNKQICYLDFVGPSLKNQKCVLFVSSFICSDFSLI